MKKYVSLFTTHLSVAIEYRSQLIGIIVTDLVGFASIAVLWLSVFRDQSTIGGLTVNDTVLYYLFVPLIGFITQVNMAETVASEIRQGYLSTHLLKPQNIWVQYIMRWLAAKVNAVIVISPVYVLVFVGIASISTDFTLSIVHFAIALMVSLFAFGFSIVLDLFFAWMGFWLDDIWWFRHFKYIVFGILAGSSFPFEFLPQLLRNFVELLPFKFMYYIPIQYLLGNRELNALSVDLISLTLWTGVVFIGAKILWTKGVTRYDAYGN